MTCQFFSDPGGPAKDHVPIPEITEGFLYNILDRPFFHGVDLFQVNVAVKNGDLARLDAVSDRLHRCRQQLAVHQC